MKGNCRVAQLRTAGSKRPYVRRSAACNHFHSFCQELYEHIASDECLAFCAVGCTGFMLTWQLYNFLKGNFVMLIR